ncbi:MAG: DUF2805 domain-containing protein [Mangrovimonas sp.]|nr:DUF2805 domain-containing protein [Mangrovimonas sp.]MCB0432472.1 DUF2805 domain-containing protein [Mangrovimonas sp.]MCB0435023.1 DUF2805 domain-containing protein [Mangrovimonas sp.]MCB0469688.1 DUF2805 domain-containing protein [Flavobacteriaceae bacterium]
MVVKDAGETRNTWNSFKRWRKRVNVRHTKFLKLRLFDFGRFKCSRQRNISKNVISKR